VPPPDPTSSPTPAPPEPNRHQQRVAVYGILEQGQGEGLDADGPDGDPGTEVLLVRAAPYLTVAGPWFLPGGGLDHGESPADGLRREFLEETGLTVTVGPLLGVLSDVFTLPDRTGLHTLRIIYGVHDYAGDLRDEVDGSSDCARWIPVREALTLPLRPYVRRALTELRS
jgi:8-oxo-dGTP pyrophosphatase MutT (NUDIX family)